MIELKLLKITLYNFACYFGENTLDFTKDNQGKNIYLFDLPNGYGKTSLFHAIKWGFYGDDIEYYKDSDKVTVDDFLNDRLDPAKDYFFVQITFEYDDDLYVLKRKYQPSVKKSSILSLSKNGEIIADDSIVQEELDNIIPKNFADFFMFDGERLSRFMTAQKELIFRDSIHQLLGLKQIRVLHDDLVKLNHRYEHDLAQQKTTNKDVEDRKKTIQAINHEIENLNLKIGNARDDISKNEDYRDKLDDQRKIYANLPNVMKDLNKVNDNIVKVNSEIAQIRATFDSNSKGFHIKFIQKDLVNYIEANNERVKHLQDICGLDDSQAEYQSAREDILKKCIPQCSVCGHTLSEEEKNALKKEQQEIRDKLRIFEQNKIERDGLKNENSLFKNSLSILEKIDFQKNLDLLVEKSSLLETYNKQKYDLVKESEKEEYGSLAELNREISLLEQEITKSKDKIKIFDGKIREFEKSKEDIMKEIRKLGHDDLMTDKITKRIAHVSKLIECLEETLEIGTESKRGKILQKSNDMFMKITNKPHIYGGIDFENRDSYAFVIKTKDGKTVKNPSKGEKMVLAMSFLLGLSQYTGRNNVILMDTPVASLDDVHSAGIGKALAGLKNQVIFLAQPQELKGDIYKNMQPSIAKEFTIENRDYRSKENYISILKEVKV